MSKLFKDLKKWQKRAICMHRLDGLSIGEVSEQLGVHYDAVYSFIKRHGSTWTTTHLLVMRPLPTIFVIGDTQAKDSVDLEYMSWIGHYIALQQPDIIVHIGDHWDMESLSMYDKGTLKAEGKRFHKDIESGIKGMQLLEAEINAVKNYKPRKVFCLGNHEERIQRWVNANQEFTGAIGYGMLGLEDMGWEVHDYLKPVKIHGINFVHYLANNNTGKPLGGTAKSRLAKTRESFVMGHQQTLDWCIEPMTLDSTRMQIGLIIGACYQHDEGYKGYQGNNHFRGACLLAECNDGSALPQPISLTHMHKKYLEGKV